MGEALDERGRRIGEAWGQTKKEVFDELLRNFPNAHEFRIKTLKEKLDEEEQKLRERKP